MGTDNPKVSAYVPQSIKDRLKQFREERNISESQAVTIILAEYFQVSEVLGRSPERAVGGVTLARMEALEERLVVSTASLEHQLQELREAVGRISGLPAVYQVVLDGVVGSSEQDSSLPGEPQTTEVTEKPDETPTASQAPEQAVSVDQGQDSGLLNRLLDEPLAQEEKEGKVSETLQELDSSNLFSGLKSELPVGEHINQEERPTETPEIIEKTGEPVSSLLSGLPVENTHSEQIPLAFGAGENSARIDIELLARRLRMAVPSVRNKKSQSKLSDEEFTEWTTSKDVSKIGWKSVKEGKRVYYEPAADLDSELLNELLAWIRENGG